MRFLKRNVKNNEGMSSSSSSSSTINISGGTNGGGGGDYHHPTGMLWGNEYNGYETLNGDITSNGVFRGQGIEVTDATTTNLTANDATIYNLFVSGAAHFNELVIDKVNSSNGMMILSPAHAKITRVVETSSGNIRCFFKAKDDEGQRTNDFAIDDLVLTMSFNNKAGNKFVWKRVTAKSSSNDANAQGEYYFEVRKTGSSGTSYIADNTVGEFEVDDVVCVLGHWGTDSANSYRRNAILLNSTSNAFLDLTAGITAPSIVNLKGINNFSVRGREVSVLSPTFNKISAADVTDLDREIIDHMITADNVEEIIQTYLDNLDGEDSFVTWSTWRQSNDQILATVTQVSSQVGDVDARIGVANTNISVLQSQVNQQADLIESKVSRADYNSLSNIVTTQSSLIAQTASKIDLVTLKDDIEMAGVHIDGDNSKISLTASNFEVVNSHLSKTFAINDEGELIALGDDGQKITISPSKQSILMNAGYSGEGTDSEGNVLKIYDGNGAGVIELFSQYGNIKIGSGKIECGASYIQTGDGEELISSNKFQFADRWGANGWLYVDDDGRLWFDNGQKQTRLTT